MSGQIIKKKIVKNELPGGGDNAQWEIIDYKLLTSLFEISV